MKITLPMIKKLWNETEDKRLLYACIKEIFKDKQNIGLFGKFFFPNAVKTTVPEFHNEMYNMLLNQGHNAFAAPRGHAKSTIAGLVFISYCICYKLEPYIVYISQNHTKTVQFLEPLRHHFSNNKMLRAVFGDLTPGKALSEDGRDREDCIDVNGARVEAVSFEKNLRGFKYKDMRPTLIIGDDIESDERVLNPELRAKDKDKLNKVIIPALDIDGKFKFIGTILHCDSLLLDKIKLFEGKIYAALNESNKPLWSERFTLEKLMAIKTAIGSVAFQQEYMNNPIDNVSSLIKREWILRCFDDSISQADVINKSYQMKVLGVDFAFSDRVSADKSAFISLGRKSDNKMVMFQGSTKKGLSVNEQLDYIRYGLHKAHSYDIIALEENSIKSVSKEVLKYNLPFRLYWTGSKDPADKYKQDREFEGKRRTVGKINLIQRLGAAFERGDLIIPYKTDQDKTFAHQLLAECTSYALSDGKLVEANVHPDIPIGLGYAHEAICEEVDTGFAVAW